MPQSVRAHDFSLTGLMDVRFNAKYVAGQTVPTGSIYRNGLSYNVELYPRLRLQDNWTITAIFAYANNATGKTEDPFDLYRLAISGQIMLDITAGSFKIGRRAAT